VVLVPVFMAAAVAATPPSAPDTYAPGWAAIADHHKLVSPKAVQERFEVELNGTKQAVSVRGADRDNPILLWVHGGPAAPETPTAWMWQRPWEDFFTVVQWDQRGSGRSYQLNDPEALKPTLKPETYVEDAVALIEHLKARYGKRKVILLGHSWGSVVGLKVAAQRPDLLHAYVGMGQVISFRENERVGYAWSLEQARKDGNAEAVRELEAIAPYPGDGPLDVAKMTTQRKWSVHYGGLAMHRKDADFYFRARRLSPEYTPEERVAIGAGSELTIGTMFPTLATTSMAEIGRLNVPVYMLLGRGDYTTPSTITAAWMKALKAPRKQVFWFENSAHLPMVEEPGLVLRAVVAHVRPEAVRAGDGPKLD
jgi:proline iminopeptidase